MQETAKERVGVVDRDDVHRLQESFRAFTRVTRSLEQAYGKLEQKATGIDRRLQDANRRLVDKITELKSATTALTDVLLVIPCGVVTADAHQAITRVNPAAERILGRSASELLGRDARSLRDHRGQAILLLGAEDVPEGTTVDRFVGCFDGAARHLSGSIAALQDGGRLEIVTDQTEVAHLRSQVTRLDTLAALGEMAAGIAHEIRNPLSGVQGFAALLEKAVATDGEPERATLRRYADRIRRGVVEVDGIISDLLTWARPDRPALFPVRICEVANETRVEMLQLGHDITLENVGVAEDTVISGDRLKLKLALGNLLRNAVEAAGDSGKVVLRLIRDTVGLKIIVDDSGPGIAPELRLRLFRPFATTKAHGHGLGLALVRKFVELQGGSIDVTESPFGGARFILTLSHERELAR